MPSAKRYFCSPRYLRLSIVAISLVAHFGASVGFPVPEMTRAKSSVPFPCQHHRCGCLSPEQCWKDCCCMTHQEKLAWAKKNNITPPDYVLAEAKKPPKAASCCCS